MTITTTELRSKNESRGTVLVADDDPIAVEIISRLITNAGCDVQPAANGLDALKIIGSTPVDAIVLDMRMPQLDGFEVCLDLFRKGSQIPILVMTGCIGDSESLHYLNVSRTLNKPVRPEDVLNFVNSAMEAR